MDVKGKSAENEFADAPKILGDDFLMDLKAADVPDSDDECYFWNVNANNEINKLIFTRKQDSFFLE